MLLRRSLLTALLSLVGLCGGTVQAQLRIGQTAGSIGPESSDVTEAIAGARQRILAADAEVRVEGLGFAAAKRDLTRTGLPQALGGTTRFDLGGLALRYSASDHTGLDCADLSISGAAGRSQR
jgi:hypothetical protein